MDLISFVSGFKDWTPAGFLYAVDIQDNAATSIDLIKGEMSGIGVFNGKGLAFNLHCSDVYDANAALVCAEVNVEGEVQFKDLVDRSKGVMVQGAVGAVKYESGAAIVCCNGLNVERLIILPWRTDTIIKVLNSIKLDTDSLKAFLLSECLEEGA